MAEKKKGYKRVWLGMYEKEIRNDSIDFILNFPKKVAVRIFSTVINFSLKIGLLLESNMFVTNTGKL